MVQESLALEDLEQLENKGISLEVFDKQINNFKKGFSSIQLIEAATIGNGIQKFSPLEIQELAIFYDEKKTDFKTEKFVPASGAASRMFKKLFAFCNDYSHQDTVISLIRKTQHFSFGKEVIDFCKSKGINHKTTFDLEEIKEVVNFIISGDGLNFGNLPKGMIPFHEYEKFGRTAFEEHLVEGALYCKNKNNTVNLHFTVAPQHQEKINKMIEMSLPIYEKEYGVKYNINYSVQETSTDTVAVDMNNEPFRLKNGKLLFRPGGHGALLDNLNKLESDIIFIKNIDNVVHDRLKEDTVLFKKALAAYLIKIKTKVDSYLRKIENNTIQQEEIDEAFAFAKSIGIQIDKNTSRDLFKELNKPIRVCGMVKNEGEPGGGPFWIKDTNNHKSLQIVEGSQINKSDKEQKNILNHSTHFNPVDLICSITDFKNNSFNLFDFRDDATGFISYKSVEGTEIKAQELPGLWNGAMANWITLFVEVPLITFNPVKTIQDLLRNEHQA